MSYGRRKSSQGRDPYQASNLKGGIRRHDSVKQVEVTVATDFLNAQSSVHSLLPNATEEIIKSLRKVERVKATGYICGFCGYQSKKWVVDGLCRSKIDCEFRASHPNSDDMPYWYSYGKNTVKIMINKIKKAAIENKWTQEEVDEQVAYLKERFYGN